MKLIVYGILFFACQHSISQHVVIDTIKVKLSNKIAELPSNRSIFPKVSTGNKSMDSLINRHLIDKLTREETFIDDIETTLNNWASYGLVDLFFEIGFNQNGILSLRMDVEFCGTYCEPQKMYFNYSTQTGKSLRLSDIVDLKHLEKDINQQKTKQYQESRSNLKDRYEKGDIESKGVYQYILNRYNECDSTFKVDQFYITDGNLNIIEQCYINHASLPFMAVLDIHYSLEEIRNYLKFDIN